MQMCFSEVILATRIIKIRTAITDTAYPAVVRPPSAVTRKLNILFSFLLTIKLPKSSSKVKACTSSQPGQAPLVLPIVAYGKRDVNGGRCMIIYNKNRRKIHVLIFLLLSSFPLYLKNYIHALLMVNQTF